MLKRRKLRLKIIINIFACLFLAAALLLTGGCWDRREIQDLSINTGLGIDRIYVDGKPQFLLSTLTVRPAGMQQGGGMGSGGAGQEDGCNDEVISSTGETIYDAVRNWNLRSSRQLYLSHTLVLVIGEEMAREGIGEVLEFARRHRDVRLSMHVVVCRGTARDALQAWSEFEANAAVEITKAIHQNLPRVAKAVEADLFRVTYDLVNPGIEPVVSRLVLFTPPEAGHPARQGDAAGSSATEGRGAQPQNKVYAVSGAAVFRGDRLVGWLEEEESQGLLFMTRKALGGIIPVAYDSRHRNASFHFRATKSSVKPVIEGNQIIFEVKVCGGGQLLEQKNALIDINERDIKKLEALINREVERRCLMAAAKSRKLEADVFGFGNCIHRTMPEYWKQIGGRWREIYPTVQVQVKADFLVEHTGLMSEPLEFR